MKRRVVAALAALLVAAVGGAMLLSYVAAADSRAVAGLAPARVLVVTQALPEGATAEQVAAAVEVRELPGTAVAPGVAVDVKDLTGLVTTTALEPGEQLLRSRLADPAVLQGDKGVQVPKGYQQVSVKLDPQRAVGGTVVAGATVAVFLSLEDDKVSKTGLELHKVLVTAVQGGLVAAPAGDGGTAAAVADVMTVTLAVKPAGAQRIVFAAEYGTIWLAAEPADASDDSLPILTKGNLYR